MVYYTLACFIWLDHGLLYFIWLMFFFDSRTTPYRSIWPVPLIILVSQDALALMSRAARTYGSAARAPYASQAALSHAALHRNNCLMRCRSLERRIAIQQGAKRIGEG